MGLRGWWGNPWGFESPLRHHRNNEREFGFAPSSLFSFFRPVWLKCGSGGIPLVMLGRFTGCRSRTSSLFVRLTKLPRNRSPSYVHAINRYFGINRLSDWRCAMSISIRCNELGMDCHFVTEGETGEVVTESLMRHVQTEHTEDWFEIEEIYQAACSVIREKAA